MKNVVYCWDTKVNRPGGHFDSHGQPDGSEWGFGTISTAYGYVWVYAQQKSPAFEEDPKTEYVQYRFILKGREYCWRIPGRWNNFTAIKRRGHALVKDLVLNKGRKYSAQRTKR